MSYESSNDPSQENPTSGIVVNVIVNRDGTVTFRFPDHQEVTIQLRPRPEKSRQTTEADVEVSGFSAWAPGKSDGSDGTGQSASVTMSVWPPGITFVVVGQEPNKPPA